LCLDVVGKLGEGEHHADVPVSRNSFPINEQLLSTSHHQETKSPPAACCQTHQLNYACSSRTLLREYIYNNCSNIDQTPEQLYSIHQFIGNKPAAPADWEEADHLTAQ
jgi:hypothetical protein